MSISYCQTFDESLVYLELLIKDRVHVLGLRVFCRELREPLQELTEASLKQIGAYPRVTAQVVIQRLLRWYGSRGITTTDWPRISQGSLWASGGFFHWYWLRQIKEDGSVKSYVRFLDQLYSICRLNAGRSSSSLEEFLMENGMGHEVAAWYPQELRRVSKIIESVLESSTKRQRDPSDEDQTTTPNAKKPRIKTEQIVPEPSKINQSTLREEDSLKKENEAFKTEITAIRDENENLKDLNENLKLENDNLKAQSHAFEHENYGLRLKQEASDRLVTRLKQKKVELGSKLAELQDKGTASEELLQEIDKERSRRRRVTAQFNELSEKGTELLEENQSLKEKQEGLLTRMREAKKLMIGIIKDAKKA